MTTATAEPIADSDTALAALEKAKTAKAEKARHVEERYSSLEAITVERDTVKSKRDALAADDQVDPDTRAALIELEARVDEQTIAVRAAKGRDFDAAAAVRLAQRIVDETTFMEFAADYLKKSEALDKLRAKFAQAVYSHFDSGRKVGDAARGVGFTLTRKFQTGEYVAWAIAADFSGLWPNQFSKAQSSGLQGLNITDAIRGELSDLPVRLLPGRHTHD